MLIGIDGQALSQRKSGLGVYTEQLLFHLKELDSTNQYVLIEKSRGLGERTYERLFWENVALPAKGFRRRIDLLHTPAFSAPVWKGNWRSVVTIHDLIGMIFPENLSRTSRWYWGRWLPFVNGKGERIIVDSHCTRTDIIRYLKVNPERIRVVPLGVSDRFTNHKTRPEIEAVCKRLGVQMPYILFVGTIEPRKNLMRAVKGFAKVRTLKKIDHQFVLVGSKAWGYPMVHALVSELGLSAQVKFLNYIDDDDLISLYNGGDLLLFPSLYEGFGMPILEAMKCGMPVLTSNVSAIPEVAGDAAFYVDPYREEEIAAGIEAVLKENRLAEDMRQRAFVQAAKFDWRETAKKTLAVYRELLN